MNKVQLTGRLARDVEVRHTADSTSVTNFSVAVKRRKKDDGADFVPCIAWGNTAELLRKYVSKGDRIGISGRIQTGSYEKEGRKIYTVDVVVEELEFLESASKTEAQNKTVEAAGVGGFTETPADDDLPF